MRKLLTIILLLTSLQAFANGRCQYPNLSDWSDCRPPIPVLVYHHVSSSIEPGETVVAPENLEKQLDRLKADGWTTITMSQLGDFIAMKKQIPRKSIAITFDDGWRDQLIAANLLRERKQVATFYVLSSAFDDSSYLSQPDLIELSKDFEIGTHTHSHFKTWSSDLTKLDVATAVGEVVVSKAVIESIIRKPVKSLAWPYGYFTEEANSFVKNLGITTIATLQSWNGPYKRDDERTNNPFDVQRLNIDGRCTLDDFIAMVETLKQRTCR